MTLMKKLVEAGYPQEDFFRHESDLYIYLTPLTKRVVDSWFKEQGLHRHLFVSTFTDQITGRAMYDIAFQYTPYWEERSGGNENKRGTQENAEPVNQQNGY